LKAPSEELLYDLILYNWLSCEIYFDVVDDKKEIYFDVVDPIDKMEHARVSIEVVIVL